MLIKACAGGQEGSESEWEGIEEVKFKYLDVMIYEDEN